MRSFSRIVSLVWYSLVTTLLSTNYLLAIVCKFFNPRYWFVRRMLVSGQLLAHVLVSPENFVLFKLAFDAYKKLDSFVAQVGREDSSKLKGKHKF